MKSIKRLLLTGFIVGCTVANIFAMEDDEMRGVQAPAAAVNSATSSTTVTTSSMAEASTSAMASSSSQGTLIAAEERNFLGDLSVFPNELLVKIFAQLIEDDLKNQEPSKLINGLTSALSRLSNLSATNKGFANFLRHLIIYVLRDANIIALANKIDPDRGEALLHRAIRTGKIAVAKILIGTGVDINAQIIMPRSPGFLKSFPIGTTPLLTAVKRRYVNLVALLIQCGADITVATFSPNPALNNITVLGLARNNGLQPIVELLEAAYRERGLDVSKDDDGFTLAMPAASANPARHLDFDDLSSDDEDL